MKVLVTGGAGFIGSHTVDRLLTLGHDVRVLDNLSKRIHPNGKPNYLPRAVEFIEGDVRDRETVVRALDGIDAVYHFAAYQDYLTDFSTFFHVNTVGTALLYEIIVARRIPIQKFILASSQAVYGEGHYRCSRDGDIFPNMRALDRLEKGDWEVQCPVCGSAVERRPTDESQVNPQNSYAISKFSQELIALSLGKRYGIPTVVLRYSIVQGPRQSFNNAYSGACRVFCTSLSFNQEPLIFEDGEQLRDYVNIDDVVDANILVLDERRADFQVFNVGGGSAYSVLDLARIAVEVYGSKLRPKLTGEFRVGDTRHIVSDISRLSALGWRPKYSPEKSVRDYAAWLKAQKKFENMIEQSQTMMRQMRVLRKSKASSSP